MHNPYQMTLAQFTLLRLQVELNYDIRCIVNALNTGYLTLENTHLLGVLNDTIKAAQWRVLCIEAILDAPGNIPQ